MKGLKLLAIFGLLILIGACGDSSRSSSTNLQTHADVGGIYWVQKGFLAMSTTYGEQTQDEMREYEAEQNLVVTVIQSGNAIQCLDVLGKLTKKLTVPVNYQESLFSDGCFNVQGEMKFNKKDRTAVLDITFNIDIPSSQFSRNGQMYLELELKNKPCPLHDASVL